MAHGAMHDTLENDWGPVAIGGGAARLSVPVDWRQVSRDDGGLALQPPGLNDVDLLVSVTAYRNPYGVSPDDSLQYLDRDNLLPHGISAIAHEDDDDDRRWIAYLVEQPPDRKVYVWKVAHFSTPDHVAVVTVQLLVTNGGIEGPLLDDLVDRLGEEAARIEFAGLPPSGAVQRVTMRNVAHGDLVRFRLPWDWAEDQDGDLSVFYHRDWDAVGTLRVAVHTFPHEGGSGVDPALAARVVLKETAEQFADGPQGNGQEGTVEWLPAGGVVARFSTLGEADGDSLRFHLWLRGVSDREQTTLALFSFAVPEESNGSDRCRAILSMLDREIRAAVVGAGAAVADEDDDGDETADA